MKNENIGKTIKTVRTLGVMALLLSGFIFLIQGYMDWDGFERFLAFSGVNLLIGGFGIFCAQVWQEPKGARTMLALAGAGVSAQFAQLGGMIYNVWHKWQIHAESLSQNDLTSLMKSEVPQIFSALDVQPLQVLMASVLLLVVGGPILAFAFKALNRGEHQSYKILFIVNALFLLLPFRAPWLVVPQLALAGVILYKMIESGGINLKKTYTFEKWITLLISMSPVLIGVIRSLFYVNSAEVFLGILSLGITAGCFLYQEFAFREANPDLEMVIPRKKPKHSSTLIWSLFTWSFFALEITNDWISSETLQAFLILTPVLIAVGEFVRRKWLSQSTGEFFTIFILGGFAYGQLMDISLENGLLLASMAGVGLAYGFINRSRTAFTVAAITLVAAIVETAVQGLSFKMIFSWINLAGIGIVTILLASFMEKRLQQIKSFQKDLSHRFSGQS